MNHTVRDRKRRLTGVLAAVLFTALTVSVPEVVTLAAGKEITSSTMMQVLSKVNVRREPNTSAEVLGQLESGEKIFAVELTQEGWYQVAYNGETGYVRIFWKCTQGEKIGTNPWERMSCPSHSLIFLSVRRGSQKRQKALLLVRIHNTKMKVNLPPVRERNQTPPKILLLIREHSRKHQKMDLPLRIQIKSINPVFPMS